MENGSHMKDILVGVQNVGPIQSPVMMYKCCSCPVFNWNRQGWQWSCSDAGHYSGASCLHKRYNKSKKKYIINVIIFTCPVRRSTHCDKWIFSSSEDAQTFENQKVKVIAGCHCICHLATLFSSPWVEKVKLLQYTWHCLCCP